jgi:hypothetical protein
VFGYNIKVLYFIYMKYFLIKTVKDFLLSLLLVSVAVLFIHLQLEIVNCDMGPHDVHDYSLIIKNTNPRTKTLNVVLPNSDNGKILCQNCTPEVVRQVSLPCFYNSQDHLITKQSTQIYLFNSTFLI